MESVSKLDSIINKINLVLEQNLKLEERVKELKKKITDLEKERKLLVKDSDGYKKEMQLMKIAKSVEVSDEERGKMKKELKKYIREIDKCMALLNK